MKRRTQMISLWLTATASAHAGGHFDVDDAYMLDPGRCQLELWGSRLRDERTTGWHLGSACRVGPVELGVNADRVSVAGDRTHALGPQLKWTFWGQGTEAPVSAAVFLAASFDLPREGRAGGQFVVPVSWRASDRFTVHANLGADWAAGSGARTGRGGMGAEWVASDAISAIVERHRAFGIWTSRVGARIHMAPSTSVDISASRTGHPRSRGIVIGLNHEFGR